MKIVCPMCKKTLEDVAPDFPPRPFCSARCKLLDLGNWLSESYRIPEPIDPLAAEDDEGQVELN